MHTPDIRALDSQQLRHGAGVIAPAHLALEHLAQDDEIDAGLIGIGGAHPLALFPQVVGIALDRPAVGAQQPTKAGPVQGLGRVVVQGPMPPGKAPFTVQLKLAELVQDQRAKLCCTAMASSALSVVRQRCMKLGRPQTLAASFKAVVLPTLESPRK